MSDTPKETVYDAEIAPLMTQVIETCKRAGISVHAAFHLDGDLFCTTHVLAPDNEDTDEAYDARQDFIKKYEPLARRASEPLFFAYTITSASGPGAEMSEERSKYQREYDALPEWAQQLVRAVTKAGMFGHRVEFHAVYCHNEAWPNSPRKCRRNRTDYRHEDCPGFVANPDFVSPPRDAEARGGG